MDSTGRYLGFVAQVNETRRSPSSKWWLVSGAGFGAVAAAGIMLGASALLGTADPPEAAGAPRFIEETADSGIQHVYDGEFEFFVGGGVAVFDCDEDGLQELFFAGGVNPSGLFHNQSEPGRELRFSRLDDPVVALTGVTGAYPLDVDGDSHVDLAVLRHGENVMLRGLGDCRFEPANDAWNVDGGSEWTAAFSAVWEDEGTVPTLAFGNYLADDGQQTGECADHYLLRPEGSGGYQEPMPLSPGWCTLSILFSDWDRSGRSDLRMTNDRHYYRDGEEQLWRMDQGADPELWTHDEGWQRIQIWGMGIASHDLTGDGRPEIFLTSQGDNKLQTLADGATGPQYTDIAFARGVTAHRPFAGDTASPSTAWHAEFQDVNNDTYMDLFVTKGNVEAQPDFAARDPNNLLLGLADGTFRESADDAGVVSFARSRGAALADLNLDGLLDLVVVNRRQPAQVWRNLGTEPNGNWLALRLSQAGANRDAVGAWVEIEAAGRTVEREVTVGGGHAGGQIGWLHFGLAFATEADIRVVWPDGEQSEQMRLDANQFATIERGQEEPERWLPPGEASP